MAETVALQPLGNVLGGRGSRDDVVSWRSKKTAGGSAR